MDYYSSQEWLHMEDGHPGGAPMTKSLIKQGDIPSSGKVLDLCCGRGDTIAILRKLGYEVVGIDASKEAIEIARVRFETDCQVVLYQCDARDIPLMSAAVQSVICECSLSLMYPEAALVLAELKRLLQPGGCLLVSDVYAIKEEGIILTKGQWLELFVKAGFESECWLDETEDIKAFAMNYLWQHGRPFPFERGNGNGKIQIDNLGYFLGVWR